MNYDPNLPLYGHPILPTGFNSWELNGDDWNGPGVNEPVWPLLIDTSEVFPVIVVTPAMLEVFAGCADLVFVCDTWQVMVRPEDRDVVITQGSNTISFAPTSKTVQYPREVREIELRKSA
jgi:hypothetical protein